MKTAAGSPKYTKFRAGVEWYCWPLSVSQKETVEVLEPEKKSSWGGESQMTVPLGTSKLAWGGTVCGGVVLGGAGWSGMS